MLSVSLYVSEVTILNPMLGSGSSTKSPPWMAVQGGVSPVRPICARIFESEQSVVPGLNLG